MPRVKLAITAAILLTTIGTSTPVYAAQLHPSMAQLHPSTALTVNDKRSGGPAFACTDIPSGGTPLTRDLHPDRERGHHPSRTAQRHRHMHRGSAIRGG
jgi:hypothetical protein